MIDDLGLNSVSEFGCATVTDRDLHLSEQLPFSDRERRGASAFDQRVRKILKALRLATGQGSLRTATVSEARRETPLRPLLPASSSSTGEPAPRYLPRELRHRSAMRSQGVGDSTPAAGSRAVPAGRQCRPEGSAIREVSQSPDHARDWVADRKARARLPIQARTGCVQGPPCLLLQALQRTAPGAGGPQPYIDQSPWCSLGSANGHRWFRCENRHACLEAHRLSHLSEKTPEMRRSRAILVALAAFVAGDLIFGRRA